MPYGTTSYGGSAYGGLGGPDDPWVEFDVTVAADLTAQHQTPLASQASVDVTVAADLTGHYAAPLAGSVDLDITFDATSEAGLESWHGDDSQRLNLDVWVVANLSAPPKPVPPPPIPGTTAPAIINFERISYVFPAPALDAAGLPANWVPTSTVRQDWGRYQIVVDGVDITFFRGIPTLMGTMGWNEPFGDNTLDLTFPQVGPWETPGAGALTWMRNGVDVEVWRVLPDGSRGPVIFEGRALIRETNVNQRSAGGGEGHGGGSEQTSFGKSLHVLGAIYAADLVVKTPAFNLDPDPAKQAKDLGWLISSELNGRSGAGMIHLGPCDNVPTGIEVASKGSGTQLINGYVQDLLGQGSVAPLPSPGSKVVGTAVRPDGGGYWVCADDGTVVAFGTGTFYGGSMVGQPLAGDIVGMDATPSGHGYWLCGVDGGVFAFGDAGFYGSTPALSSGASSVLPAGARVVGIAPTPTRRGYWVATDVGGVYAFGDATFHGSGPGVTPIVGIAALPSGSGYWLLDNSGHVYAHGDAAYYGGGAGTSAMTGIAPTPTGAGYWLVDQGGHVYSHGDATYHGNATTVSPAAGIAALPSGSGYWIVDRTGHVYAFGDAAYHGGGPGVSAIVGLTPTTTGNGYWLLDDSGHVYAYGDAAYEGGTVTAAAGLIGTADNGGYQVATRDGHVLTFGDAVFYGALTIDPVVITAAGIARTPSGHGYWIASDNGAVYSFGDATYHGGGPGATAIVGIAAHPAGGGYWLVDDTGHVYAYGSAGYHGGGAAPTPIAGIAATATGGGYWLVDEGGQVYAYGDATYLGNTPDPINQPASGIVAAPGGGYIICAEDGGVFCFDTPFWGSLPGNDGEWQGWTLSKYPGRRPVVELKNRWQVHATVRIGQPGVTFSLHVDETTATKVIYGEGTDRNGHSWRNSKYPNLRPITPPIWPGITLRLGTVDASVATWSQAMHDAGWRVTPGTTFTGDMQNAARAFQLANGLEVTGTVGAQTWAATFVTGSNNGDLTAAYVAPIAEVPEVDPYRYDAFGAVLGPNPNFDRSIVRVERWETFGEHVDRPDAALSATAEVARDSTPAVVGTVTLTADPNEMSRLDLRAGMNLLLQGFEGRDVMLHIAGCSVAWNSKGRPVTLTVDEHARDMLTVAAIRARDRSTTDPVRRLRHNRRASRIVPDRAVPWDFEAGGGIIPKFVLATGLWSVIRVPAASAGTVVRANITTEAPVSKFAVAIFNQPVTPANIKAHVANPLAVTDWSSALPDTMGLVISWGQQGQGAGYYPSSEDAGGAVTGVLDDSGSWQFQSLVPPWLWVALWAPVQTVVSGRLYPEPAVSQ